MEQNMRLGAIVYVYIKSNDSVDIIDRGRLRYCNGLQGYEITDIKDPFGYMLTLDYGYFTQDFRILDIKKNRCRFVGMYGAEEYPE